MLKRAPSMNSYPHSVVSESSYSFSIADNNQTHVQLVDGNALQSDSEPFITELSAEIPTSHSQIDYVDQSSTGPSQISDENFVQDETSDSILYSQSANPVALTDTSTQQDADVEPIDLDEVQKIQARMPAADPSAPVGSNKNPIRIIQQGNQYITTQDVSDEHLQQIIQVLTNQALLSTSSDQPSAIYNRMTNKRIIFKVTKAKRRHDDSGGAGSAASAALKAENPRAAPIRAKGRGPWKNGPRKRRRRVSEEEDPDFEPEVPEEEILPFPLARRTATAGRVSKPPKHLVKDYKHLRLEDLTTKPGSSGEEEHSDGGYSDYVNSGVASSDEDKGGNYSCSLCSKVYNSKLGLSRHRNSAHGSNSGRPRSVNAYVASMKRRNKLAKTASETTDDELLEFFALRLSKLLDPWDYLLLRSTGDAPFVPQVSTVMFDYVSLVERTRAFLSAHLEQKPSGRKDELQELVVEEQLEQGEPHAALVETVQLTEDSSERLENHNGTFSQSDQPMIQPTSTVIQQTPNEDDRAHSIELPSQNGVAEPSSDDHTNPPQCGDHVDETAENDEGIIVKVDTPEQSDIFGLPCGKYVVKEPLCEEYLSRRFQNILAAQRAITAQLEESEDGPVLSVEAVVDDDGNAVLREDTQLPGEESQIAQDGESQDVVALGDELFLVPEGGLGGPVPDEWLENGSFLAVLTEAGELSDLVMEATTGRLFHRPTGHLVSVADGTAVSNAPETESEAVTSLPDYGAYEDEQPGASVEKTPSEPKVIEVKTKRPRGRPRTKHLQKPTNNESLSEQDRLLQRMAETGEVIDLNTLFPGVSVTEVSPGVCLVTKPNGDRFNVEHGGEGITLETLQTILQMDAS